MTYIEFFDNDAAENISASLAEVPDRVVFIGHNSKLIKKHIENYKKVFLKRGQNTEFLYRTVSRNNLNDIEELLLELINTYDDCVFDISGGEEAYVFALGLICGKYPDKNIQIQKVNLNNNTIYNFCGRAKSDSDKDFDMSVTENVRIYGGDVVYGDISEEKTYKWDLNKDFICDINMMWSLCKTDVRKWNAVIGILGIFENIGQIVYNESFKTIVKKSDLQEQLGRRKMEYETLKETIDFFLENGLVKAFNNETDTITISYKNEQVKKCLTKAGLVLEMKIYITAKSIIDPEGNPIYNDVVNGAVIDWDSEIHNEADGGEIDIENEIDVLLMHGAVPVFISCKNGFVDIDELYKLNTVAERFGGENVKKILVTTAISSLGSAEKYIRQRAEEMNIKILDDVHCITDKKLEEKLKNLWC